MGHDYSTFTGRGFESWLIPAMSEVIAYIKNRLSQENPAGSKHDDVYPNDATCYG